MAADEGMWLVALEQVGGKGRQSRPWVGQPGNFLGSTLVRLRPSDPAAQTLSLVAGLALAETIDAALPGQPLMLKWPNDLLLNGAKLAGILLERAGNRVVAGFGVNLAAAPDLPDRRTAHLGKAITPEAFAPLIAATFARLLRLWRDSPPQLFAQAWLARTHPIGTLLTVHGGDGELVKGAFDGIDPDGSLRLRVNNQIRTIHAGDVSLG